MGGIIHAGTKTVMNWTFHATCNSLGLKSGVMHLIWPSIILVYDSDRSKDAVTFKAQIQFFKPVFFQEHEVEVGALVSTKCFASMRKVTSHSERNSIILASSLGRMFWVALNAGSRSGTCAGVGTPTVPLAYSSAKKSRHILETHWLGFSISMVILARAMDQATWIGNAIAQMSALVLLLGVLPPLGGIAWLLLRCFYCVAFGFWRLGVLTG